MRMRSKLTIILLFTGMIGANTVGGVAYWVLMRDFQQQSRDQAFEHFSGDLQAYLTAYGSWEQAVRQQPFTEFVKSKRNKPAFRKHLSERPMIPPLIEKRDMPPFRFLVLNESGIVLKGVKDYPLGMQTSGDVLKRARPITFQDKIAVLASPIGEPMLLPSDKHYLAAMRQALFFGIAVAIILALLTGLLAGRRMTSTLSSLTTAIKRMSLERETELQVPVHTKDELGELADAFNHMNRDLTTAHRELRESSELIKQQAEQLKELSIKDPLTDLFNRRYYDEQAKILFEHAVRYQHPITVMIGDLDHFKHINDNFSHALGDEVLRCIAQLLKEGIRKSDVIARYGGEEFVILFPNSSLAQAGHCCEILRQKIESYPWFELHPELSVTMSMGLCEQVELGSIVQKG